MEKTKNKRQAEKTHPEKGQVCTTKDKEIFRGRVLTYEPDY